MFEDKMKHISEAVVCQVEIHAHGYQESHCLSFDFISVKNTVHTRDKEDS